MKLVQKAGADFNAEELAAQVYFAVVPTTALFSQAVSDIVNFYLDDDKRKERDEIVKLASVSHGEEAVAKIMAYIREALREFRLNIL